MYGPCEWPVAYVDCEDDVTPLSSDTPAEISSAAEEMATTYLWNWTGQRFGVCTETVRPCRESSDAGRSTWAGTTAPWTPVLLDGQWFNLTCGSCSRCRCGDDATALHLPGPVASIGQVLIDGTPLPVDAYRVDDGSTLVRIDGGTWPTWQDMSASPSEPNTFEITYQRGLPVPIGGRIAAGVLAMEFVKALCDDNSCRLPRRVQSITRQGVSMAILDAFEDIEKGHTGIWVIDSWVASVLAPKRGGTVASPDFGHRSPAQFRRTTWPA